MLNRYLTEDEELPDGLDWEAQVEVILDEDEDPRAQVKLQNLSWESALGQDFQDLVEGLSCEYHELLDGYLNVGYIFSECRMNEEDRIEIKGQLHPVNREHQGNYYTNESQVIASATLRVRMKDQRTHGAIREYLERDVQDQLKPDTPEKPEREEKKMKYKYLTPGGDIPQHMDWDADVEVVPDGDNTNPDADVKIRNLGWEQALYYDGPHFRELVEQGGNYVYHDRIDGLFLVGYAFSDCMVDDQDRVIVKGFLHPATETIKGDYHTDESQVIASAVLRIKMKDQRTLGAIREYLGEKS